MENPPAVVQEIVIDHQAAAARHLATMSSKELDKEWLLDQFFGCIYVINLPQAKDRLKSITKDLHSIGVNNFKVFSAVDGRKELKSKVWKKFWKNWHGYNLTTGRGQKYFDRQRKGEAGCFMSHFRVIEKVKRLFDEAVDHWRTAKAKGLKAQEEEAAKRVRRYSSVLILEDDNGFGFVNKKTVTHAGCGTLLREALKELPPDWDILYFGYRSAKKPEAFTPHLVRLNHSYGTNAYAVHYTMYKKLYKYLKRIEDPAAKGLEPLDNELSHLFTKCRAYAIDPKLSYQRAGKSYITTDATKAPAQ